MSHKHNWIVVISPDNKIIGICATEALEGKNIITAEQLLRGDLPERECNEELSLEEIERRVNNAAFS